jgi:AcrR family transcriptional regulator
VPRPKSLTPDQLAAAARAVLARDGAGALSMRSVAAELGAGTMSLYRYVSGREALEALVVDHVMAALDPAPPPPGPWKTRVAAHVERLRAAAAAEPAAVPLILARGFAAPGLAAWLETLLGLLAEAGVAPTACAVAARAIGSYVIGAIQLEHFGPLQQRPAEAAPTAQPQLAAAARTAAALGPRRVFRRGLMLLLGGLASA